MRAQPDSSSHPDDAQLQTPTDDAASRVRYVEGVSHRRVIPVGDAQTIVVRPRVPAWYKALLGLSLGLNVLVLILLVTAGATAYRFSRALSNQVATLTEGSPAAARVESLRNDPDEAAAYAVDTARHTVDEALAAVQEIEGATINTNVPIDQQLPLQLQVPIQQDTVVTTNAAVPLVVPAQITFPGGGGNLNATVALNLPAELQLPIRLGLSVPLSTTVPVRFDVPVSIPLRDTELAGPFARLRRLLEPAAAFFRTGP